MPPWSWWEACDRIAPTRSQGVQSWRAQSVDEAPHVGDGGLCLIYEAGQQSFSAHGVHRNEVPCGFGLHGQAGELWPESVVQVAPQAPPFLFARVHQPLSRPLQIGGEAHGFFRQARRVGGHADLVREVFK